MSHNRILVFLTATATTEIYTYGHTLSLHDALPILERPRGGDLLAAHRRGAVEQPARGGHSHHCRDLGAAARLADHHHPRRITAERRDIVAHLLEREDHIQLVVVDAVGVAGIDRKSVVSGKSWYVLVDFGGRRIIKKNTKVK